VKLLKRYLIIPALMGLFALQSPDNVKADPFVPTYLPNNYGKSLTTPVAWGASNGVVFMGAGGTIPSSYTKKSDGAAALGFGIGDPDKNLGIQVTGVSLDLTGWGVYSGSVHVFKNLGNCAAIGAGVENIMLTKGGDAGKSYYGVYSQGIQADPFVNTRTGRSDLTFSIGGGNGRFGDKTPWDIASGKGAHGTYAFGNIAYDFAQAFNVIVDWNGLNLNAGVAKTVWVAGLPLVAVVGAADLTNYSGDRVRFIFAAGTGFKL